MIKKAALHFFRIVSVIAIIVSIGAVIEKIIWYSDPKPSLAELTDIRVCLFWLVIGAVGVYFTSRFLKKDKN